MIGVRQNCALAARRPKHGGLSAREIEGTCSAGVSGNLLHCSCTYVYVLFTCVHFGKKPGFLHSKSGCRDPVSYTRIIPVKTGWLVGMRVKIMGINRYIRNYGMASPGKHI